MSDVHVPNITEGAMSGLQHEALTPRPASTLKGSSRISTDVQPLGQQASDDVATTSEETDASERVALADGGSPVDYTVTEINDYLAGADDDEKARILDAELARDDGTDPRVSINGLSRD